MFASTPTSKTTPQPQNEPLLPRGYGRLFFLVTVLFFLWAIPNNLNDILIRQFMKSFTLTRFEAGLVQSAFYFGYFLMALPAGLLIKTKGYKAGFLAGLFSFALGCVLFWPAAAAGSYAFFLSALFIVASGLAFLETAANPFIAQLGPAESAERRLNLAQAFNPLGAITGVLIGTRFIFSGVELRPQQVLHLQQAGKYTAYLHHETLRVFAPYLVLGGIVVLWAILIMGARFPATMPSQAGAHGAQARKGSWKLLLQSRTLLFAVVAQFLYVGAQVGTWSYFIPYAQEYTHVSERAAGLLLTGTLVAFGIGRFGSAYLMRWIAPGRMMLAYSAANLLLLAAGILAPGWPGLICILLTSFFMSIMYPTIFSFGLRDAGEFTNIAGSLLVMAILGGAVLTPLMGLVAEFAHSNAIAYLLPAVSYVVIAYFSRYAERKWNV